MPGARSREEFLAGLKRGRCSAGGGAGSYLRLTLDVARIFAGGYAWNAGRALDGPRQLATAALLVALLPALPLLPLVTAGLHAREQAFARRWFGRYASAPLRVRWPRPQPVSAPLLALGDSR